MSTESDVLSERRRTSSNNKKPLSCRQKRNLDNTCGHDTCSHPELATKQTPNREKSKEMRCALGTSSSQVKDVLNLEAEGKHLNPKVLADCSDEDVDIIGSSDSELSTRDIRQCNRASIFVNGYNNGEDKPDNFDIQETEKCSESSKKKCENNSTCERDGALRCNGVLDTETDMDIDCRTNLQAKGSSNLDGNDLNGSGDLKRNISIMSTNELSSIISSEINRGNCLKSCTGIHNVASPSRTGAMGDDVNREQEYIARNTDEARSSNYGIQLEENDEDDFDPYNRFFFESDHLALKDNEHYQSLLQVLVALEGQKIQAIKDLDTLCEVEAQALDEPITFVEKLQNNEPLGLPERQRVASLPSIPWEEYAAALGPLEKNALSAYHHTRTATQNLEKAAFSAVKSCASGSSESTSGLFSRKFYGMEKGLSISRDNKESKKTETYNQPWTKEEQCRLEKLLQVYPQEEVEAKRWEKIAKALGNRTMKQVASRVQKYFIKLAKAGLPVPGRMPNVPKLGTRSKRHSSHYSTMGFRTSTFFPSYQPRVYMEEGLEDMDGASVCNSEDASYISDEEVVPHELRTTPEYKELMELKSAKRQKLHNLEQGSPAHHGFMCDACGTNPIIGTRYHCRDCAAHASVDFCASCVARDSTSLHNPTHRLEPMHSNYGNNINQSHYVDGDYVGLDGSCMTGYNYLDPNFLPAVS